jgi:hypothetical protein
MADGTQMKTNIDKVSYGVGGALAVILLALPFLLGGTVKESTAGVEKRTERLEEKKKESTDLEVGELKFSQNDLSDLWLVSGDDAKPIWRTQRRPALVRIYGMKEVPNAVHVAPCVTSIELVRDPDTRTPVLRVTAETGSESAHIVVDKVVLERKVGEDGEWAEVPGFSEAGSFTYDDKNVEAGQSYAYRCTSFAKPVETDGEASKLEPDDVEKVSNELSTDAAIPHDLAMRITNFGDLNRDPIPRYRGIMQVWDYAEAKKKAFRQAVASKGWERGFEFGDKLDDGKLRYRVRRVVPEEKMVTIDDRLTGESEKFTQKGTRALRPTEGWDIVTHDCTPAPAGDAEDTADAGTKAGAKAGTTKKAGASTGSASSKKTGGAGTAKGAGAKKTGRSGRRGRTFE